MNKNPIYLATPYQDKPWFYCEQDPKTHIALPYYTGAYVDQLRAQLEAKTILLESLASRAADVVEGLDVEALVGAMPKRVEKLVSQIGVAIDSIQADINVRIADELYASIKATKVDLNVDV